MLPGFNGDFAALNGTDPKLALEYADAIEDDERLQDHDPPMLSGESRAEWIQRVGSGRTRPLRNVLGEKHGLERLCPPWWDYWSINIRFIGNPGWVQRFTAGDMRKRKGGEHQDAFIIDYRFPVEPQLEGIRKFALSKRARRVADGRVQAWPERRLRVVEWLDYLRILDGLAAGASRSEIGKTLFPTDDNSPPSYGRNKRVNNSVKAARELCEVGYRYIPWMKK
ncbi:MAG: hypothetical protein DI561_16195 [Thauera sp.]|nr:MAG: hypothetical protein DI561_16195 [Thauera sp.]